MPQRELNLQFLMVQKETGQYRLASPEEIIKAALKEMPRHFARGQQLTSLADAQNFVLLRLAPLEHEVFAILWLDNRHRELAFAELFRGTINGANVHPREVVKSALKHNAAVCIFAHNHPSGDSTPSQADRHITNRLKETLDLIDVRTLDHVVIAEQTSSFTEQGLLWAGLERKRT